VSIESDEIFALREQLRECHGALSRAFGVLMEISLLTRLEGEVDDYGEVVRAVSEIVDERDTLLRETR
jgi:hypothetical protein